MKKFFLLIFIILFGLSTYACKIRQQKNKKISNKRINTPTIPINIKNISKRNKINKRDKISLIKNYKDYDDNDGKDNNILSNNIIDYDNNDNNNEKDNNILNNNYNNIIGIECDFKSNQCDPIPKKHESLLEITSNQYLLLAGGFDNIFDIDADKIGFLNPKNNTLKYYKLNIEGGAINAVSLDNINSTIYIAGSFDTPHKYIFSINKQGIIKNIGGLINGPIKTMHIVNDTLYVGGYFSSIGNITANNIALYNPSYGWRSLGNGSYITVSAISDYNGLIYAAISRKLQTLYSNQIGYYLAKWNGHKWLLTNSLDNILNNSITNILIINANKIYIGGKFNKTLSSKALNAIALYDGYKFKPLGDIIRNGLYNKQFSPAVVHKIIQFKNYIYIGGNFLYAYTNNGTIVVNNIVQWDESKFTPLGKGIKGGTVYDMCILGTDLYVVGNFDQASDVQANNIARWDGNKWYPINIGANANINVIKSVKF